MLLFTTNKMTPTVVWAHKNINLWIIGPVFDSKMTQATAASIAKSMLP
jgi:hypothetical protein